MNDTTNVTLRLAALAFVTVLVQIAGVAQIRILGVSADLSPLAVAAATSATGSAPRCRSSREAATCALMVDCEHGDI